MTQHRIVVWHSSPSLRSASATTARHTHRRPFGGVCTGERRVVHDLRVDSRRVSGVRTRTRRGPAEVSAVVWAAVDPLWRARGVPAKPRTALEHPLALQPGHQGFDTRLPPTEFRGPPGCTGGARPHPLVALCCPLPPPNMLHTADGQHFVSRKRRPQGCIRREGTSEVAPEAVGQAEEVAKAAGGGYCRLAMPLSLALAVRETAAGRRTGALEGGGGSPPSNASLPGPALHFPYQK